MQHFFSPVVAAPELLRCLHNFAPQAEERRGETRGEGGSSELAPEDEPRTTS